MQKSRLLGLLGVLIFSMIITSGCASHKSGGNMLLPSSENVMSSWGTYDEAVTNYGKIKVGMTEENLKVCGVYDGAINVKVLNWLSVYKMLPEDAVKRRKLDQGMIDFLKAGDSRVKAFEVYVLTERRHREGSFFLDTLSFKRTTRTTGYEFSGLILLVDSRVTYVLRPTGGPIDKVRKEKKPLGPFQGLGSLAPSVIESAL